MKFIVFVFCVAITGLLYFLYFETSLFNNLSTWPGPPSIVDYDGNWVSDFMIFLITNKVTGCIFMLGFVCGAFSVFGVETCKKCGSPEISYGQPKAISKRYKHPKKNGNQDLRYKDNPLLVTYNTTVKCGACSHSWKMKSEKATVS